MRWGLLLLILLTAACGRLGKPDFDDAPPPPPPLAAAEPERERWQPRPVTVDARRVETHFHTVTAGETLASIARRTGASRREIASSNYLVPPYTIRVGQRLRIPGGRYHTVSEGETGIAIAEAYKVKWRALAEVNGLEPPYLLRIGDKLLLPGSRPDEPAEAAPKVAERSWFETVTIDDLIAGGLTASPDEPAAAQASLGAAPPPFDGRFGWPVDGRVVSRFGRKAGGLVNDGVNIAAAKGTPIRAAADGVVVYAGNGIEGFGNLVMVKHGDDWVSAYAHADAFWVERGDRVKRGERIAEVGETGSVDSPQLHFELRRGRRAVDPLTHLPAS